MPIWKTIIIFLVLLPLVKINFYLREKGLLSDKWFWADVLMVKWGYYTNIRL